MSRVRSLCLATALTMVGAGVVATSPSEAAVAPNGDIAYVAYGPADIPFGPPTQADVWVMAADGTGAVNLTDSPSVDDTEPAFSPDGSRIAYVSDSFTRTLMVMNADGSGQTAVIDGAYNPSWSPDGERIAVLRSREGLANAVVIVDLATAQETVVTERVTMEPAWSPDGSRIAFVDVRPELYPDPITGEPIEGAQHEIVVANVDGSGEVVVSAGAPGSDRASFLEEDRAPAWSPDGSMLVFMSQAQNPSCCGPWQLWGVNADGSGLTNLTADETVNDLFPSWSPDGSEIVFSRSGQSGFDLYTMPAPSALPLPALARANAPALTAITGPAVALTSDGNASDPSWGALAPAPTTAELSVTIRRGREARGRVDSTPAGISCGFDCRESYAIGTTVKLEARPGRQSRFAGWTGACTGRARVCTVRMDADRAAVAHFVRR